MKMADLLNEHGLKLFKHGDILFGLLWRHFRQPYYLWGPQILVLCGFRSKGIPARLNELMLYYPIATLIYCLLFGHRILFAILTSYTVAYNLTKFTAKEYGYV